LKPCAASQRSEDEIIDALEHLLAHSLIAEVGRSAATQTTAPAPMYDFSHEKLRTLVYEDTSLARRRLLHRRVAEALLVQTRAAHAPTAFAGHIAQHYRLAGQAQQAATYFKLAGEHARTVYANQEALADFEAALALNHPDAATLHEAIGDLRTLGGEYAAAIASYEAALAQCVAQHCATIRHKLAGVHQRRGAWGLAEQQLAAALTTLGTTGTSSQRARIAVDRSLVAHQQGKQHGAQALARQALELAKAADDPYALAQAHNILGILASRAGDFATAQHHLEQSLALAETLDDRSIKAAALNNLALVYGASGDVERAIALTEQALRLCAAQGDRHREAALHNNLADLLHTAGHSGDAMAHLKHAVAIYAEIGVEAGTVQPAIWKLAEW
jgi:tetratricopeptide (TPR) repeat protein